jgi:hypothetical protein
MEPKHDGKMAPRPKLFWQGDDRNESDKPKKSVLGLKSCEHIIRILETDDNRKWIRPELFVSLKR